MLTMIPQQKLSDALPPVARELGEQVKKGEVVVPLLPKVANRVISLTQTEDSNAAELASLIQSDQTLAGHVIRVANSAAYSPVSSIVSLQQAITRLGMATIAEIALAATVNASLFNAPGFEALIQHLTLVCNTACINMELVYVRRRSRLLPKNHKYIYLCYFMPNIELLLKYYCH